MGAGMVRGGQTRGSTPTDGWIMLTREIGYNIIMDTNILRECVKANIIEWRKHALERMLQRGISREWVKQALLRGEIIESYQDDRPFESALFFDDNMGVIHVVASVDEKNMMAYVITAYEPDNENFLDDMKTRRQR